MKISDWLQLIGVTLFAVLVIGLGIYGVWLDIQAKRAIIEMGQKP